MTWDEAEAQLKKHHGEAHFGPPWKCTNVDCKEAVKAIKEKLDA